MIVVITVTSWWVRWRLKSPASRLFAQPFVQSQIKENIKAPCHWSLWGESTGDRWIPLTRPVTRKILSFDDVIMEVFPSHSSYVDVTDHAKLNVYLTNRKCLTRRTKNAYMRQWSGSSLVQEKAWRLFGAKYLPNKCLLIVNSTVKNKSQ